MWKQLELKIQIRCLNFCPCKDICSCEAQTRWRLHFSKLQIHYYFTCEMLISQVKCYKHVQEHTHTQTHKAYISPIASNPPLHTIALTMSTQVPWWEQEFGTSLRKFRKYTGLEKQNISRKYLSYYTFTTECTYQGRTWRKKWLPSHQPIQFFPSTIRRIFHPLFYYHCRWTAALHYPNPTSTNRYFSQPFCTWQRIKQGWKTAFHYLRWLVVED